MKGHNQDTRRKMDKGRPENTNVALGPEVDEEFGPGPWLKNVGESKDKQAQSGQDFYRAFRVTISSGDHAVRLQNCNARPARCHAGHRQACRDGA